MSQTSGEPDATSHEKSEDLDQLQREDTLVDRGVDDVLDEGYSPPENWGPGEGFGSTAAESLQGESLDQRIAQELPDLDPMSDQYAPAPVGDEVGDERSGRLVAPDEGLAEDEEQSLVGNDVGIDGAASSAEEAAVRIRADQPDDAAGGRPLDEL
ncbi:DUF5709 domain-containing protein [Aeromicrobium sp. CTD01-1L150]|uniref:DUF5709 domain-containing protein n=1 Tax=Aeromicrobium sp. CTD01-1L150 TaxID=3341830 RepID=UPI0035BF2280